jgi:hypothetical protein
MHPHSASARQSRCRKHRRHLRQEKTAGVHRVSPEAVEIRFTEVRLLCGTASNARCLALVADRHSRTRAYNASATPVSVISHGASSRRSSPSMCSINVDCPAMRAWPGQATRCPASCPPAARVWRGATQPQRATNSRHRIDHLVGGERNEQNISSQFASHGIVAWQRAEAHQGWFWVMSVVATAALFCMRRNSEGRPSTRSATSRSRSVAAVPRKCKRPVV